ncbi:MAG: hypothetical protein ABSF26_10605 [Thermoguttaceae bacterium]|jgi:hypothetical protein
MPRFAIILLLVAGIATAAHAQQPDRAQGRAKELKVSIKSFRLALNYHGDEDKPFYRLWLRVGAVEQSGPFQRLVSITEEQASKIIDHLAADGFLSQAKQWNSLWNTPLKFAKPQGYVLTVSGFADGQRRSRGDLFWYEELGWDLPMLKRLDGLRKVLGGDAAKDMDLLLGRLSGLRAQWEKEGKAGAAEQPKAGQAQEWKNLYADEQWYKDHKQPEQVFTCTLQRRKEAEVSTLMRSHRYQLGDRFIYPGKEHPELEKLVGQKIEVRGKPYDVELEGQAVSEIWAAAVHPAAPVEKPDDQKKVDEVAAELGGKAYPECIWVSGVYVNLPNTKVTDAGLERLKRFPQIKGFNLGGTQVTDAGLEHLKGLTKLRRLELNKTRITDAGLEHIKGLPQLEKLFLNDTKVTDTGLKHLQGLQQLEWLYLGNTPVTDAGLEHLKGLPQLRWLELGHTQITDAGLERLKGFTKLERLGLKDTPITDAGLQYLNGLTKLTLLDLGGTKITDAGLADLKELPQLQTLYLSGAQLTEPMLERLRGLPQLKTLGVHNPQSKGVDDLKKALPHCNIQILP